MCISSRQLATVGRARFIVVLLLVHLAYCSAVASMSTAWRGFYRRRRDAMVAALREHFPAEATWTEPEGGLFIWATLPEYIDTSDLLARALRDDVAFVPGQAAYVDGRGRSSMRLNFSGVGEDEIREGIRRIGAVIAEQVSLYGALTGTAKKSPGMPGRGSGGHARP